MKTVKSSRARKTRITKPRKPRVARPAIASPLVEAIELGSVGPVEPTTASAEALGLLREPTSTLTILPVEESEQRELLIAEVAGENTIEANLAPEAQPWIQSAALLTPAEALERLPEPTSTLAILPVENEQREALTAEVADRNPIEVAPAPETQPWIEPAALMAKPNVLDFATRIGRWIKGHVKIQPARKRLRVCETVSLGDKRFIAVVQLDGQEFLVGGAPNSLSLLLANVEKKTSFSDVLNVSYAHGRTQA